MQVYLSYAKPDKAFAKSLAAELTRRGLTVWSPEEEVLPGDNLHLRVGDALAKSKAMVVLVSPESMKSPHIRSEIEYALGSENYEGRLFPVEVRPSKETPWILRKLKVQNFTASQGVKKISESIAGALKQIA